jgi:spore maturation protein CgeB
VKFLILNTDYSEFLSWLYTQHAGLENRSYEEQLAVRTGSLFGDGGFYSSNLRKLGHEAEDIYLNNEKMQKSWAREHGIKITQKSHWNFSFRRGIVPWISRIGDQNYLNDILKAQIQYHQPDIVLNQAINMVRSDVLKEIKASTRLLVGQIASPLLKGETLAVYDLIITSSPNLFNYFSNIGLNTEFVRLGFQPDVLKKMAARNPDIPVSFVGSFFPDHKTRTEFLEYLCQHSDLNVWGNGINRLPEHSAILNRHKGHAWGTRMYEILRKSKITINHHTDIAGAYASNMRLYEATGVGTMLITDWKENLKDLFELGREVVAYRSPEECKDLISYYLTHDDEREAIALAGQQRTLSEHTYYCRMKDLAEVVNKHLGAGGINHD